MEIWLEDEKCVERRLVFNVGLSDGSKYCKVAIFQFL